MSNAIPTTTPVSNVLTRILARDAIHPQILRLNAVDRIAHPTGLISFYGEITHNTAKGEYDLTASGAQTDPGWVDVFGAKTDPSVMLYISEVSVEADFLTETPAKVMEAMRTLYLRHKGDQGTQQIPLYDAVGEPWDSYAVTNNAQDVRRRRASWLTLPEPLQVRLESDELVLGTLAAVSFAAAANIKATVRIRGGAWKMEHGILPYVQCASHRDVTSFKVATQTLMKAGRNVFDRVRPPR